MVMHIWLTILVRHSRYVLRSYNSSGILTFEYRALKNDLLLSTLSNLGPESHGHNYFGYWHYCANGCSLFTQDHRSTAMCTRLSFLPLEWKLFSSVAKAAIHARLYGSLFEIRSERYFWWRAVLFGSPGPRIRCMEVNKIVEKTKPRKLKGLRWSKSAFLPRVVVWPCGMPRADYKTRQSQMIVD